VVVSRLVPGETVTIYNPLGQKRATLSAGADGTASWNVSSESSGEYAVWADDKFWKVVLVK
jgi:hypothetical protein